MAKYHINQETGRVNICRAQEGNCPLKNIDGTQASHFDNKSAAMAFNERELSKTHKPLKTIQKRRTAPAKTLTEDENRELTQRLINEYNSMIEKLGLNGEITLSHYQFTGSSSINRLLHNEMRDYEDNPETIERNKKDIAQLDKIIEEFGHHEEKKTLYRYLNFDKKTNVDEFLSQTFQKGGEYSDAGFMSTTEDLAFIAAYAKKYSRRRNFVILEIETNKGISMQTRDEKLGDLLTFEKERLLPRDMTFTVDELSQKSIKIDLSRQKLMAEFNGYSQDWKTGEKTAYPISAKKFNMIKLTDKSM